MYKNADLEHLITAIMQPFLVEYMGVEAHYMKTFKYSSSPGAERSGDHWITLAHNVEAAKTAADRIFLCTATPSQMQPGRLQASLL